MVDASTVALVMGKELKDARRSRWFLLLAVVFAGLALALSLLGMSALGAIGGSGFGRTTASLLNLVMIIVPLMGLLMGAMSVAREREHGTLQTILAQPVVLEEVLLGKFLGLAAALLGTILLGFGLAAMVIARQMCGCCASTSCRASSPIGCGRRNPIGRRPSDAVNIREPTSQTSGRPSAGTGPCPSRSLED
jgi:hypothetical protein